MKKFDDIIERGKEEKEVFVSKVQDNFKSLKSKLNLDKENQDLESLAEVFASNDDLASVKENMVTKQDFDKLVKKVDALSKKVQPKPKKKATPKTKDTKKTSKEAVKETPPEK